MQYQVNDDGVLVTHQDGSSLLIPENVLLENISKKMMKYEKYEKYFITKKDDNISKIIEDIFLEIKSKFPNNNKLSQQDIDTYLRIYSMKNKNIQITNNIFKNNLPDFVSFKRINKGGKTIHGYYIHD